MGVELTHDWRGSIASALDWWSDAGVDMLADEEARDWLALPPAPATAESRAAVAEPIVEALPETLVDFVAWRMSDAAPEAGWMTPRIAPVAPETISLMILTDLPGPEDHDGLLGGLPGRLLDRMLAAIGESRESVYLASLAWARPLTGRIRPDDEARLIELARHHVMLAQPKRLLLLGQSPGRVMDGTNGDESSEPKADVQRLPASIEAVASYHPRFLLERPAAKAEAWRHLLLLSRGTGQ